jgi:SAM-dependent methyltransferase
MAMVSSAACEWCGGSMQLVATFTAPPAGETAFEVDRYERSVFQCDRCAHVVNRHDMTLDIYGGAYRDATYGDAMVATYERIMALPPDRSDNRQRVVRVERWAAEVGVPVPATVLDVGSGLGVFPAAMVERGWTCTALDPDPVAVEHLGLRTGAAAVLGTFGSGAVDGAYEVVTFNKVLEHVEDPVAMLTATHDVLAPDGVVYVELPDGEAALALSAEREELFIEHHAAYSMASTALLAVAAGFRVVRAERLVEPSTKRTIAALLAGRRDD